MNSKQNKRRIDKLTCRPAFRVAVLGVLGSVFTYGESKEVAVGVVVSAFLLTPFLILAGCCGGNTTSKLLLIG